jgi:hypothetical protein
MWLQTSDDCRPVAKIGHAGKKKIASPGKKIPRQRKHKEVASRRTGAVRLQQQELEDTRKK